MSINLKLGRLIEGPPKPKEKIQNLENSAPEGLKLGMETSFVCLCKKADPLVDELES
jgi:hypothetical protein